MGPRLKIYLAGASKDLAELKPLLRELREMGHEISHDWTVDIEAAGSASPDDRGACALSAMRDLRAVRDADVVWLRAPKATSTSTGAWVEVGAAIASGVPVVSSGDVSRCIFSELFARRFDNDDEALALFRKASTIEWKHVEGCDTTRAAIIEPAQSKRLELFVRQPVRSTALYARDTEAWADPNFVREECLDVSEVRVGTKDVASLDEVGTIPAGTIVSALVRNEGGVTRSAVLVLAGATPIDRGRLPWLG